MPTVIREAPIRFRFTMPVKKQKPRVWYKILVNQNPAEIKRVLELLFKYGYVYHATHRFKSYLGVCQWYSPSCQTEWEYLRIGHDEDCNHVINCLCFWEYNSTKEEYETVTIEQFLEINGYIKKPIEEKKIILTLDEFNAEFERQRKKDDFDESLSECA